MIMGMWNKKKMMMKFNFDDGSLKIYKGNLAWKSSKRFHRPRNAPQTPSLNRRN